MLPSVTDETAETMPLTINTTKQRLKSGKMALGFGVHPLRTAASPMLAAATGHDWMFIDTEHGAFSVQETTQLCIAALPTGVTFVDNLNGTAALSGTRLSRPCSIFDQRRPIS